MQNSIPGAISAGGQDFFKRFLEAGTQLHAIEIFQQDTCILRWAAKPYSCSDKREVYSLSKSFTSTAVGLAFDKGLLHPDDYISRFFPQQVAAQSDPRWQRVRLRHLLSMTTGHGSCPMTRMALSPDSVQAFFETPLEYEPGEHFAYSTGASCVLAEIVRRVTGETVPDLLAKEMFAPMQIENIWWETCADGRCQGGTGLKASCDDVAKLGRLYCQRGRWNQRQLLSEEWVKMATAKQASNENNGSKNWCAGYGFQFWQNMEEGFRGDGAFGQLCVVLPEKQLVAVVMAESVNMTAELDVLWELLEQLQESKENLPDLPVEYQPIQTQPAPAWDSGWMQCQENPMGFTCLRLVCQEGSLRLTIGDGQRVQTLCAKEGQWQEQWLWAKQFRPMLYRQMPRTECTQQRLAVSFYKQDATWVLECRMLNTPHRFCWMFTPDAETMDIRIQGAMDVYGPSAAWQARRMA